jgi:glycosyltransferase involved in cell wall biosynthesis
MIKDKVSTSGRRLRKVLGARIAKPFVIAPLAAGFRRKRISAMMRVKNEEAFLRASVESIVPLVEEIVIVDNGSSDATPRIARELALAWPDKVRVHNYPHEIAKVGADNQALAATPEGRQSPRLLANYYNWCLRLCRMNFVLKWDGDMIATRAFGKHVMAFKASSYVSMGVFGANLHPDRLHLVAASESAQRDIKEGMDLDHTSVLNWTSPYTAVEPRLFPRFLSSYRPDRWWCEVLHSPFERWPSLSLDPRPADFSFRAEDCGYLHLKYCKPNPYENFSDRFAGLIKIGVLPGPDLPVELQRTVESMELRARE